MFFMRVEGQVLRNERYVVAGVVYLGWLVDSYGVADFLLALKTSRRDIALREDFFTETKKIGQ
jgi:hypothetical protein